ncbi:Hypothetical protein BQ3484_392 [Cedratvirus A11]|uniref:Uncharacterized protein n=1 Tax=Cedratvirus A11 TaxID=1903266 RepID=A0A1M7XV59_9VIRU|nr:Hypothetical protein BQ3484_392 [Cedratvirus A11]SHO33460.1 Hypothetical protein BQ3484_392 [Cedratvirus A11]
MSIFEQAANQLSISREYWDSIPFPHDAQKYAYLCGGSRSEDESLGEIKDEDTLLQVYERAMREQNHAILSKLHLKCFSLKLLPLASRYGDLVTLSSILKHRRPEEDSPYLKEALLRANPLCLAFLNQVLDSRSLAGQIRG